MRFGNVLGSSGSVVPIFERQIARGGPVTVTDERMTRYFMTIPEAVQLIIRSGSLVCAEGGGAEVFVLDMGEPVRIVELARAMIDLSGLDPEHDIEIEIVGRRAGEKLSEELFNDYERALPTPAEKIMLADRPPLGAEAVESMFAEIGLLVLEGDAAGLAAKVSALSPPRLTRAAEDTVRPRRGRGGSRARTPRVRSEAGGPSPRDTRTSGAGRLSRSYTPRIHDRRFATGAIAVELVHEDRGDRRFRRARRDRGPVAAGVRAGARAQAPARMGRSRPRALRRTGAARQRRGRRAARGRYRRAARTPRSRQVPRTTPLNARPVTAAGQPAPAPATPSPAQIAAAAAAAARPPLPSAGPSSPGTAPLPSARRRTPPARPLLRAPPARPRARLR